MSHLALRSSSSSLFSISLEEKLEIEKVAEAEAQGSETSELAALHQDVVQGIKDQREIEVKKEEGISADDEESSSTDEEGTTDPESSSEEKQDTETDTQEESDPPSEEDKDTEEPEDESKEDEEKEEVSSESFRSIEYEFDEVATESFDTIKNFAGKSYEGVKFITMALGSLGITYGPKIASRVYKGVLYGFALLGKGIVTSIDELTKYIDRRVNAFDKLSKDIEIAKETLKLIDENRKQEDLENLSEDDTEETHIQFREEKTINYLKIGQSTDLSSNINVLNSFVADYVESISKAIYNENKLINYVIGRSRELRFTEPVEFLQYSFDLKGFSKYRTDEDEGSILEVFKSKQVLPGDVVLMAKLPSKRLQRVSDLKQAYKESDIHLELDKNSFKVVEGINYMTSQELSKFLDSLSSLCELCISHQKYYEDIKKLKFKSRFNFKHYFDNLLDNESKVGIADSFIENIYLKNMFIDKVYIPSAMDIHDYSAKVISHGLSFAKANLEHLR